MIGAANVPSVGPCVLAFNHPGYLDGPLVVASTPRPDVVPIVAVEVGRRPLERLVVEAVGGIWIARGTSDRAALEAALAVLATGCAIAVAPEGRISRDGVRAGRRGPAFLALRAGAPLVPVAIAGTDTALRQLARCRRPRLTIAFGDPVQVAAVGPDSVKVRLQAATDETMRRIAGLLPPGRQGVYASSPLAPTTPESAGALPRT